jgi:hypothetical protein
VLISLLRPGLVKKASLATLLVIVTLGASAIDGITIMRVQETATGVGYTGAWQQGNTDRAWSDGSLVATVDAYAPDEEVQAVLFTAGGLSAGEHTLLIEVTGNQNDNAVANYIVVDAFEIR